MTRATGALDALAREARALRDRELSRGVPEAEADARAQHAAVDALFRWVAGAPEETALDESLRGHDPREAVRVRDASDDPLLHAYERFLASYDPEARRARGVFYTPRPLVRFLVRAARALLVGELGVRPSDAVLYDPAAGTGTFLFEALEHAVSLGDTLADALARVRGTELLDAPFTLAQRRFALAHPGLALDLQRGDAFDEAGLARTAGARVPVVLGNPPYAARSRVAHPRADALLEGRDPLTGDPCATYLPAKTGPDRERNAKWLRDDYVKFLRLAQWHVERAGAGVVAFALPHGLLDQATFAAARLALVRAFDVAYALDLHGDFTRRERAPDGGVDGNVFRVRSGVCLLLLARSPGGKPPRGRVFRADLWGSAEKKLEALGEGSLETVAWRAVEPRAPGHRFTVRAPEGAETAGDPAREYDGFWALDALFPRRSPCVVTARDGLVIAFTRDELAARMALFVDPARGDEEVRGALLSARDRLDLARVRDEVRAAPGAVREVLYRPFDLRFLYEHASLVERPRPGAFAQRPGRREFALLARRQSVPGQPAAYVFSCALTPIDGALRSDNRGSEQALFARDAEGAPTTPPALRDELRARTGAEFAPEALLAYAYAVLHAPSYRARYGRFHEEGFPRVPAPRDGREFALLSSHGAALLALHNAADLASLAAHWDSGARWSGDEAAPVGPLRHDETTQRLYVGRAGYFTGFTPELAGFRVGSYRPAFKWLRDREGRPLDAATRASYLGVLAAMSRTRALCEIIDAAVCSREA